MLIDTHCHLHDREFYPAPEAEKALARAAEAEVEQLICIATNPEDSRAAQSFAESHKGVFYTFGVHPEFAATLEAPAPNSLSPSDKLVAIGEVGLDYHYKPYDRAAQIALFEKMLQLARDHSLPLSFHVREAFDDFFAVLANFPELKGVVHSFSDSKQNLKKALSRDLYIGVNGLATFVSLPTPPLEKILLETDAPFLTPVPNRGKINEPAYVTDVAKYLSSKLGVGIEEIAETTTNNARKLFKLRDFSDPGNHYPS